MNILMRLIGDRLRDYRVTRPRQRKFSHDDLYWDCIRRMFSAVDLSAGPVAVKTALSTATDGQRALFAIDWCQKEIRNGGFGQFFTNSTGVIWREALDGFRLIGGERYAAILEKALSVFPDGEAPLGKRARARCLANVPRDQRHQLFDRLESEFFDLLKTPELEIGGLMSAYVRAHPGEFFRE